MGAEPGCEDGTQRTSRIYRVASSWHLTHTHPGEREGGDARGISPAVQAGACPWVQRLPLLWPRLCARLHWRTSGQACVSPAVSCPLETRALSSPHHDCPMPGCLSGGWVNCDWCSENAVPRPPPVSKKFTPAVCGHNMKESFLV